MANNTTQTRSQKFMMHLRELNTANLLGLCHVASIANESIVKDVSILNFETW